MGRQARYRLLRGIGLAAALCGALALAACSTNPTREQYQEELNRWIGQNESALIAEWGPPHRAYETRQIKYLTWDRRIVDVVPRMSPYYYGSRGGFGYGTTFDYAPSRVYEWHCSTTFEVSPDGIIQGWQYEGNNCVSR